jgi:hypothetical protein
MLGLGRSSHGTHACTAGCILLALGCAIAPPSLPDGNTVGGSATSSGTGDTTAGTSTSAPSDDTSPASMSSADGGSSGPASGDASIGSADSSSGGGTDGSTGVGAETSTGPEPPWYAGHYEGTYGGGCPAPINLDGNGTWQVDIDNDGNIVGTYSGDFEGDIDGSVDDNGNTQAMATGPQLGNCNWDGLIEANGDAAGSLECPFGCGGEWSGSKS